MNYYICGAFAYPEYIPKQSCCECNPCGIPCTTIAIPQCDLSGTVIEITTTSSTSTTSISTSITTSSTSTSSTTTSSTSTTSTSTTILNCSFGIGTII